MENKTLPDIQETVLIHAPLEKVWPMVSTKNGMALWFMPSDLKPMVGHEFHIQSPFGLSPCKVLNVQAPHLLSFAWDTDGWIITFQLREVGEKTEFTLIHSGWGEADRVIPKAQEKAAVVRERMAGGWVDIVNQLHMIVESQ